MDRIAVPVFSAFRHGKGQVTADLEPGVGGIIGQVIIGIFYFHISGIVRRYRVGL